MQTLTYEQFVELQKQNPSVVLIDVREAFEHDQHNIGGINIPLSEFEQRLNEIPKNVPVVLYCRSGGRSAMAAHALLQSGWSTVYNLAGGIMSVPQQ